LWSNASATSAPATCILPCATGTVWPLQVGRQQKPKLEVTAWTPGSGFNEPAGFGEIVFE